MMTQAEVKAARRIEAAAVPVYRPGMRGRRPDKMLPPKVGMTFGLWRGVAQLERARGRVPPSTAHLRQKAR
jgi:hypothetical protein